MESAAGATAGLVGESSNGFDVPGLVVTPRGGWLLTRFRVCAASLRGLAWRWMSFRPRALIWNSVHSGAAWLAGLGDVVVVAIAGFGVHRKRSVSPAVAPGGRSPAALIEG